MNCLQRRLVPWAAVMSVLLTMVVSPVLAAAQSNSDTSNSPTTSRKSTSSKSGDPSGKSGKSSTSSASDAEIAAAKSAGKVWVNLDSGIYHKGGRWYGKTKNGKFMTESEAKAAGYKESHRN